MATDTFPGQTETIYFTEEARDAAVRARNFPKLTNDLPKPVKQDLTFKLGNKGFQIVKDLRAARDAANEAEKAKKVAQKELNELFPTMTESYGAKGFYRGVPALTVAYGTSPAKVDFETLKTAFPEAYEATVTSAVQYFYWK